MLKKISITAAATLCAGAVYAQSMPAGFYANGNVQAEYLLFDSGDYTLGIADITLGYSGAAAGSMPLGFEVEIYTIQGDSTNLGPNFLGSIYYDSAYGRFSVGLPSAALDDYIATPSFGGSKLIGLEFGVPFGSLLNLVLKVDDVPYDYGVRYDGTAGDASFGLSLHQLDGTDYAISAGVSYRVNETYTVAAGIEAIADGGTEVGYFGSVAADYGKFGGLLNISSPLGGDELFYSIEASYEVLEDLELTAGYLYAQESIYSFGVEYTFMDDGYLGASVLGNGVDEPIYTAYVGWDFNYGG